MRFLADTNLPKALCRWLRERGHDCVHVLDVSLAQARDRRIWDYALAEDRIVISKDADFAALAARSGRGQVIWLRTGNGTTAALIAHLEPRWGRIETLLAQGQPLVEVP